jgi:hypothetical protein
MAQQVIDPEPSFEGDLLEGGSGARAANAVDRYDRGEVTEPVNIETTSTTGSSAAPR